MQFVIARRHCVCLLVAFRIMELQMFHVTDKELDVYCRMALRCSSLYLAQYRSTMPELLASGDGKRLPTILGDVFIHRSAKVHPTAKVRYINYFLL
jgi:hypothetical protein